MPSSLHALMTLRAISPRLATRILVNMFFPCIYETVKFQASITNINCSSFNAVSFSAAISTIFPLAGLFTF